MFINNSTARGADTLFFAAAPAQDMSSISVELEIVQHFRWVRWRDAVAESGYEDRNR